MSRAERLLTLMQTLRRRRTPISGADLARSLDVSLRTLYRDMRSLQAQGAHVDGEAGVGYVLRPGFMLPPLMFSDEEIEALVLGSRWVTEQADAELAEAARNLVAKVAAVLPADRRIEIDTAAMFIGSRPGLAAENREVAKIRSAIRAERKLDLRYRDLKGVESTRTVWPFALGFFDRFRVLAAWCELRGAVRHFRTDRIIRAESSRARYPRRRHQLLAEWRRHQKIGDQ